MTIDFHSKHNRGTYASRYANPSWKQAMLGIVDPCGITVADIGCGGGIYARAWQELGAETVIGVDFSSQMIEDARQANADLDDVSFCTGEAASTGIPDNSVDVVFSRAVIHHLPELDPACAEARRILKPGGTVIVQDRTADDVMLPPSPEHLRGYFFDVFPRLLDTERRRRPSTGDITDCMRENGFTGVVTIPLSEQRVTYQSWSDLESDLRGRTGRSILHELDDDELDTLIGYIHGKVNGAFPLTEVDRWTVWTGRKP